MKSKRVANVFSMTVIVIFYFCYCIVPSDTYNIWFTASFLKARNAVERFTSCRGTPLSNHETMWALHEFIENAQLSNQNLDQIIQAANHISSMDDEPEFYVSTNVSYDLLNNDKLARCEVLYLIFDTLYHELRESSLNRSRLLNFTNLTLTYAGKQAPIIDFIDAAWITSKFDYERAKAITDHIIGYLNLLKVSSSPVERQDHSYEQNQYDMEVTKSLTCIRYVSALELIVSLIPRIWYDIKSRLDDFHQEFYMRMNIASAKIRASLAQILDVWSGEVVRPSIQKLRLPIYEYRYLKINQTTTNTNSSSSS